ncbi:MAG: hypothetical protein ACYDCG_13615 [Candidatus Acidiferrales bacterium]
MPSLVGGWGAAAFGLKAADFDSSSFTWTPELTSPPAISAPLGRLLSAVARA